MHTKNKYSWLKHLDFMIVDLLSMLIAFVVAFVLKFHAWFFITNPEWQRLILLFSFLNIIIAVITDPYSGILKRSYYMEVVRALQLTAYNMISVALILYIFKIGTDYSRAVFIMMYSFYFVLSLLLKYIWKKLIVSGTIGLYNSKNVSLFIISDRSRIDTALVSVAAGDYDPYDVKGIFFTDGSDSESYNGIKVISSDPAEYVVKNDITDVLIAIPPSEVGTEIYRKLVDNAVNVHISIETIVGFQTEDQFIADLGIYKTVSVGAFTFRPAQLFYLIIKRMLDIIFGIVGLVLLIPCSAIIKLAYLISGETAGIFYTQKRVGMNGKPIKILKYRTMAPNADKLLAELLKEERYRTEWEKNQKLANDPRITRVGKLLRKCSLDELPQCVNMLLGSMSLVGPRPLVDGELEAHGGLKLYQKVKPGITGWWGCNGRSNIEYRERLELEYYYIKNFSMYLDILCVFRTFFAVLKKDGAE